MSPSSNPGGFRQGFPKGDITLADVVGVLPFDNYLIDVELTGAQLISASRRASQSGDWRDDHPGRISDSQMVYRLILQQTYHVLVNNFMYAGGDGYKFCGI